MQAFNGKRRDLLCMKVKSSFARRSTCDRQTFASGLLEVGLVIGLAEKDAATMRLAVGRVRSPQSNFSIDNREKWAKLSKCGEN
jgi:hypothetical protein